MKKGTVKNFFRVFLYCTSFTFINPVMQIVASIIMAILVTLFKLGQSIATGNTDIMSGLDTTKTAHSILLPTIILAACLSFGIISLVHVIFKKPFIKRLSFNKASFTAITAAFVIGCSLQMPTLFFMNLFLESGIGTNFFEEYAKIMEPLMQNQSIILQILAIGIVAPIIEEIIFRGLILHQLRKNIPVAYAVIIQAALFGIYHLVLVQGIYAFIIGIFLGLSLVWSRSLLVPIAMHIGMNLAGICHNIYGDYIGKTASLAILALSFLIIIAGTTYLYYRSKSSAKELAC